MEKKRSTVRKILAVARNTWLAIGISLLLLAGLETVCRIGRGIAHLARASVSGAAGPLAKADAYSGAPWATDYYKEFHQSETAEWKPYVYWRRKPFHGRYINIDGDGRRVIPRSTRTTDRGTTPTLRIFMFGGSTLWGTGARDEHTIPSALSRELAAEGIAAQVVNFGESGYVSTQELVALTLELRNGNVPDLVVFYDGVNDTYSACQQGVAGIPENEFNRVSAFDLNGRAGPFLRSVAGSAVQRLAVADALSAAVAPLGLANGGGLPTGGALAGEVASKYAGNMRIVNALAASYGFKALFYWQPTVFEKQHLTIYEQSEAEKQKAIRPFFGAAYDSARKHEAEWARQYRFRDLSGIFSDAREPLFIDWCHIAENGNQAIAREMAKDIAPLLRAPGDSNGQ